MTEVRPLSYKEIEVVIDSILAFLDGNYRKVAANKELIKQAQALEATIKSKGEFKSGIDIPGDHKPSRLAVFLLNYYGEHVFDNRRITIKNDDPSEKIKIIHNNSYILHLKDPETHEFLFSGNPTAKDDPYDFTTTFVSQVTQYPDGNTVDTTDTAWDSFNKGYQKPVRKFDFKSALWAGNDAFHTAQYTITITKDGTILVRDTNNNKKSGGLERPTAKQQEYYNKYMNLLDKIDNLGKYTWKDFVN